MVLFILLLSLTAAAAASSSTWQFVNGSVAGARFGGCSFFRDGLFYIFGGSQTLDDSSLLASVFTYSQNTQLWQHVAGPLESNTRSVYAGLGLPGARRDAACALDGELDSVYIFGGHGYAADPKQVGVLGDLFQFSLVTHQFLFLGGSTTLDQPPEHQSGRMGGRTHAAAVVAGRTLHVFGGFGVLGSYADLWTFYPLGKHWKWEAGSQTPDSRGKFFERDIFDPQAHPGARVGHAMWQRHQKSIYIFGGDGIDASDSFPPESHSLDDLWEYDLTSKTFKWLSGSPLHGALPSNSSPGSLSDFCAVSSITGDLGIVGGYGRSTFASSGYVWNTSNGWGPIFAQAPTARRSPMCAVDHSSDTLYMFGGLGYPLAGGAERALDDLQITSIPLRTAVFHTVDHTPPEQGLQAILGAAFALFLIAGITTVVCVRRCRGKVEEI